MFSKELEQSIASLFDQAQDKNIQYITIEHLLLMILMFLSPFRALTIPYQIKPMQAIIQRRENSSQYADF